MIYPADEPTTREENVEEKPVTDIPEEDKPSDDTPGDGEEDFRPQSHSRMPLLSVS